jgi:hypothetical protein
MSIGSRLAGPFGDHLALATPRADGGPSPASPRVLASIFDVRLERRFILRRRKFGKRCALRLGLRPRTPRTVSPPGFPRIARTGMRRGNLGL